jgi:CBS-domain-containing membrane protein
MNENFFEFYLYRSENENQRKLDMLQTEMKAKIDRQKVEIDRQKAEIKNIEHKNVYLNILINSIIVLIIILIYHNFFNKKTTYPIHSNQPIYSKQPTHLIQPTPYYSNYTRNQV